MWTVSRILCILLQVEVSVDINSKQVVAALRVSLAPILHLVYFVDLKVVI